MGNERGMRWLAGLAGVVTLAVGLGGKAAAQTADTLRDAAFEGAQWVMFTATANAVAGVGARLAAGDDAVGQLIRSRQQAEAEVAALREALLDPARVGADTSTTEADLARAEAALAGLEAELVAQFPAYAEFALPRPLALDEVQRLLGANEALLLIVTGATGTYVWAITPDRADWNRANWSELSLAEAVTQLRSDLDPTAPARGAAPLDGQNDPAGAGFDRQLAHRLYTDLIAPLAPVLDGAATVNVVVQGPLASLPLAVLVTAPPVGADADPAALAATDWLIRQHALVTLPAVSNLASLRMSAAEPRGQLFVGIGAPLLDGPHGGDPVVAARGVPLATGATSAPIGDPAAIRRLPALPGTERELRRVSQLFPEADRRLLLGVSATERDLRALDLQDASILHFATHGLVTGELSGLSEPALVLTPPDVASAEDDGLLTASEAAKLPLNADWVVLSACNTAAGSVLGGESLSGLARAFFLAGAQSLLVSHWPVQDDAAAILVAETIGQAQGSQGRAQALQAATLDLMQRPGFSHPTAWAPFVVVGEGGPLQ